MWPRNLGDSPCPRLVTKYLNASIVRFHLLAFNRLAETIDDDVFFQ